MFNTSLIIDERPGEVVELQCRSRGPDGWVWEQIQFLNLLDEPEIGGVVFISRLLGPVDAGNVPQDDVRAAQSDDFLPEAWMVTVLDESGIIIAAEGMVDAILGRSYDETVGRWILDFLFEEDHSAALEVWVTFLEDRSDPQTGRQRLVHADGTLTLVE